MPLYQGRMISHFDHRANSVRMNPQNTHNPYLSEAVSDAQHADSGFLPRAQYWVPARDVESRIPGVRGWAIGFRDIARPTDARTLIAAVVPWAGYGNKVPLLLGGNGLAAACLGANLNAIPLDFLARQKVQATNLNWFIVEQLPVIAPNDYDRPFGNTTARDLVRDHVLRLTYTARDMARFACDLGYVGPPFTWNPEQRRHLRARLDALYFHLYGLSREDAAYVLDTFPHRSPPGRGRLRQLPHPRPHPRLHERPRRRRYRDGCGVVASTPGQDHLGAGRVEMLPHSSAATDIEARFPVPLCDLSHSIYCLNHFGAAEQFIGIDVSATLMGYMHLGFAPFAWRPLP